MPKSTDALETGRLMAEDWVDAACRAIAEGGVGGVAVEPLARRLGVTKGSFYWHFRNRDALLRAALERWEREDTEGTIGALAPLADPRERLARLIGVAFAEHELVRDESGLGLRFTLAVSDAADDSVVGPVLRRVSERRIAYLEQEMGALGLDAIEARYRALLAYAAYLGTLRLAREAPSRLPQGEELRAYHRHLLATLLHGVEGEGAGDKRQGRR